MKRFYLVLLMFLMSFVAVSCNSYGVQGKPEVKADPGKVVFSYNPGKGTVSQPDQTTGGDEDVTSDADEVQDSTQDVATGSDESATPDTTVADEDVTPDTVANDADSAENDSTTDEDVSSPGNSPVTFRAQSQALPGDVKAPKATGEDIVQEFNITNDGKTGALKIYSINLISPSGEKLTANSPIAGLFRFELSKTAKGLVVDGYNSTDYLVIDNTNDAKLNPLCPLDSITKKCKDGFSESKYNTSFKLKLKYNKDAISAIAQKNLGTIKDFGTFFIEVCTNDPSRSHSATCPEGTSFKIQVVRQPKLPPKPVIKVAFPSHVSGVMDFRAIKDDVNIDVSKTCIPIGGKCLDPKAKDSHYYIKYRWEMVDTPTPLDKETFLELQNYADGAAKWFLDKPGTPSPALAKFRAHMITPFKTTVANSTKDAQKCKTCVKPATIAANSDPDTISKYIVDYSKYLLCSQKYCDDKKSYFYAVNIQAITVDKDTDLESDISQVTIVPNIIPAARVMVQVRWDKGCDTDAEKAARVKTSIDLDLHLIKLTPTVHGQDNPDSTYQYGYLGTRQIKEGETCSSFGCSEHDDCYYSDKGTTDMEDGFLLSTITDDNGDLIDLSNTVAWGAGHDLDNTWGGGNFRNPETINFGPIQDDCKNPVTDSNGDRKCDNLGSDLIPDFTVQNDKYLVVVNYNACSDNNTADADGDSCAEGGANYEVNAKVDVLIDGVPAPRTDYTFDPSRADTNKDEPVTLEFKIHPHEWKIIGVIEWNQSLKGKKYIGDAVLRQPKDSAGNTYPLCKFDSTEYFTSPIPIWDVAKYKKWVESNPSDPNDTNPDNFRGTCQ